MDDERNERHEVDAFPCEDGHIESILIGFRTVKVSFQTWNCRQLVLIYDDVEKLNEQNAVWGELGEYTEKKVENDLNQYIFWDVDNNIVLDIQARALHIYEVGSNADINSALFDVGYEYIGNQKM